MIKSSNYPKISVMFLISNIAATMCLLTSRFIDNNALHYTLATICMITSIVSVCFMWLLSTTLVHQLSNELTNEIDKLYQYKASIDTSVIKELGIACATLDNYHISYKIDMMNEKILADVTMGMYTRMSVANKLHDCVLYRIIGTDTVLVKPTN